MHESFQMVTNNKRGRPARIVLAEDDRATARLVESALHQTGFSIDVKIVYDGDSTIAALEHGSSLRNGTTDLLLLDLNMPGKNGFEVLKYVKGHEVLRRIPVVMFSSSDACEDIDKSYDLFANAYVQKRSHFPDLCRTLHSILNFWLHTALTPLGLR